MGSWNCLFVLVIFFAVPVSPNGGPSLDVYLRKAESKGIISASQVQKLLELAEEVQFQAGKGCREAVEEKLVEDEVREEDKRLSTFMRIYSHFTLLNVLYLSGAVITMGAYSLFMTLAVESLSYKAMSMVMGVQIVLVGVVGAAAWDTVEYAYVGGM